MARLPALPALEIIRGFKGIIDFAVWKGLPYARSWPRYRPSQRTAGSLAAAVLFGTIVKAYSLLATLVLAFLMEDAADQPRTARDIMVSAIYGKLHEASMSDFLTLLQESRDFLSDLTALLNALDSIGTDEIDVNVEDSVLPDGAATAAHQVTQNASLATIAKLEEALESVDTDTLQVHGRDQLFSYKEPLLSIRESVISGAGGTADSATPAAGLIWIVTSAMALDKDTATTTHWYYIARAGTNYFLDRVVAAIPAWDASFHHGHLWLAPGDTVRVSFIGALAADDCRIDLIGHVMTKET